ncbi:MAG TPA: hypothetical protein DEH25_15345, partial [Chloroflexi bacterium]|nr:hypothetical protein [Chloroflexota bacterium]
SGHLTDANTNADLAAVPLEISSSPTQTFQTVTNNNGVYNLELPVNTYTVTAATFGYYEETRTNVAILEDATTTLNLALAPMPSAKVSGYASDSQTGWPLYARIHITAPDFDTTVFSDPVTGYYSATLIQNIAFDFAVSAVSNGYVADNLSLTPTTASTSQDFLLDPNLIACSAPGYVFNSTLCEVYADGLAVGVVLDANTDLGINNATVTDGSGHTVTTFATPADPNEANGFYILGLSAGTHGLTATYNTYGPDSHPVMINAGAITRQDFSLPSARLVPSATVLQADLTINASLDLPLTISNTGSTTATFDLGAVNVSASSPTPGKYFIPTRRISPSHTNDTNAYWAFTYQPTPTGKIPAGQVLHTYNPGLTGLWGLGLNSLSGELWVGSISINGGSEELRQFQLDGSPTGKSIDISSASGLFSADLTFDPFNNRLWQVDVGGSDCIYALSPATLQVTGERICPMIGASQRGLAYDLTTDTFYLGSWNDGSIHHIDRQGNLLDSKNVNVNISGLAFNPMTHHIFALSNASKGFDVYVLDVDNDYTVLGGFDIPGLGDYAQAGMDIDCAGNLWIVDQDSGLIIQAASGETGICSWNETSSSWLSASPLTGSVPAGESQEITFTFDSSGKIPGSYQSQVRVDTDTPYGAFYISARMIVNQADYGVSVTPEVDALGGNPAQSIVYYLDVTNNGSNPDTYDVSIANNWLTEAPVTIGPLDSLKTETVAVTVTVPTGALPGDWDVANLTLTSQHDSGVSDSVDLTTTANTYFSVSLSPAQAAAFAVPGETASYMLLVLNTGNITDTYDISVADANWVVNAPLSVGPLVAGDSAYIVVNVEVPLAAQPGDFDIANLTVTSQGNGTSASTSALTTSFAEFKLYLPLVMR